MEELIRKSHNVSLLMYHFVFVSKYGRLVITEEVDSLLKETCLEISKRYDLRFLELGTEGDHLHLLIQSVPAYSITKIVKTVKSITAREIFTKVPSVKKKLW
ncbi:MAG: IS200/IS605 family transposase [SAR324 cluster bacterium]|nr:IS200/IS605 family transposase [SAR324 cluster bacterium]